MPNLYFKIESGNPTGSYKDRFAAAAVTDLKKRGAKLCLATSSGNTGAALASYCARANMPCFVITVDGAPVGKVDQMKLYGAKTIMVKGFGIDEEVSYRVLEGLRVFGREKQVEVQISGYAFSPEGMKGVETIGFEIAEALPANRVNVFSPAGGGGLILAIGNGFLKWKEKHTEYLLPKLHCVQPEGNNTIAGPLMRGLKTASSIKRCTTRVSGLQVPNLIDGQKALEVCQLLGGGGSLVTDDEVFNVQQDLATMEGIYCEPAGAVALAGAINALKRGQIHPEDEVVVIITGHGFKDPLSVQRMISGDNPSFDHLREVTKYIEGHIK